MESIIRAAAVYAILLVLFRIAGRRTLAEASTFDLVLLLIISEATQNALIGQDYSLTSAIPRDRYADPARRVPHLSPQPFPQPR